ncbi:MAG: FHA domain-containing protein [Vicinamibacterales bacterium]
MRGNRGPTRFGGFTLDRAQRLLARDGAAVHLTPKAFDLLSVLVAAAPRVVTKAELHAELWPDSFVSDATLTGLVKELRRALEDADPAWPIVRTVHRVGYAFCAVMKDSHDQQQGKASHWLAVPGRRTVLHEGENVIGRDSAADIWLDATSVSRRHARIVIADDRVTIEDLDSKNGTTVGDAAVTRATTLRDADRISFGSVACVYRSATTGLSTETASRSGTRSRRSQFT